MLAFNMNIYYISNVMIGRYFYLKSIRHISVNKIGLFLSIITRFVPFLFIEVKMPKKGYRQI